MSSLPRIGLVLSGGGARGAFEVGVLRWIAEHRPEILDAIRVVCGASVGAVNGAFLASRGVTPEAVHELASMWRDLSLDRIARLSGVRSARMMGAGVGRLLGRERSPAIGFFDTRRFEELIQEHIDWTGLDHQVRSGRLDGVALAATELGGGQTHLFVRHGPHVPHPRWPNDGSLVAIDTPLRHAHVLASASLPFLFAPVPVGDYWYTDGGIRQNTPLSPALRLGADRLLVLQMGGLTEEVTPQGDFPGLGQLLGKLFNSLFLDRLRWDLDRLDRINDVLAAGCDVWGEAFLERIQQGLRQRGRRPYSPVHYVNVRPSVDVGAIAARILREPGRLHSRLAPPMRALLTSDNLAAGDAASYLLFDGGFARELMARGWHDAAEQAEGLRRLME